LFGKGWMKGKKSKIRFLKENHTDFIFATMGEEFGFIAVFCHNLARTARCVERGRRLWCAACDGSNGNVYVPCACQRWHDDRNYAGYGSAAAFFELRRQFADDEYAARRAAAQCEYAAAKAAILNLKRAAERSNIRRAGKAAEIFTEKENGGSREQGIDAGHVAGGA